MNVVNVNFDVLSEHIQFDVLFYKLFMSYLEDRTLHIFGGATVFVNSNIGKIWCYMYCTGLEEAGIGFNVNIDAIGLINNTRFSGSVRYANGFHLNGFSRRRYRDNEDIESIVGQINTFLYYMTVSSASEKSLFDYQFSEGVFISRTLLKRLVGMRRFYVGYINGYK